MCDLCLLRVTMSGMCLFVFLYVLAAGYRMYGEQNADDSACLHGKINKPPHPYFTRMDGKYLNFQLRGQRSRVT